MNKTLNTIQTIMKIGKVLSIIVFVCCIIGAAGCVLGILGLAIASAVDTLALWEIIMAISEGKGGVLTVGGAYFLCVIGAISCAVEAVLAYLTLKYFKNELAAGTPFTFEGSKELFKLGLINICVILGLAALDGIVRGIFWGYLANADIAESPWSISTGVWMLLLSVFFKHGAEIAQSREQENNVGNDDVKEEIKF